MLATPGWSVCGEKELPVSGIVQLQNKNMIGLKIYDVRELRQFIGEVP